MSRPHFGVLLVSAAAAFSCGSSNTEKGVARVDSEDSSGTGSTLTEVQEYAEACAAELGPPPAWDILADSLTVPVTVDGVPLDGVDYTADAVCDRPDLLRRSCIPYSRIGRKAGTTADGAEDPDVVWMITFRRSDPGGDPELGRYEDVAMIGHRASTGDTCFFQAYPADIITHIGSPLDPDETHWVSPTTVASVDCSRCHGADPWIHTPWIDQLRDPGDPALPLVPLVEDRDRPYRIVGSALADWNARLLHVTPAGNGCVTCHRVGLNEACERLVPYATGRLGGLPLSATGLAFPHSHWMPPHEGDDLATWEASWSDDVAELVDCCRDPEQDHCGLAAVPGSAR